MSQEMKLGSFRLDKENAGFPVVGDKTFKITFPLHDYRGVSGNAKQRRRAVRTWKREGWTVRQCHWDGAGRNVSDIIR